MFSDVAIELSGEIFLYISHEVGLHLRRKISSMQDDLWCIHKKKVNN
jgi:hypothetical protein